MKKAKGAAYDTDLTADDLKELVGRFKAAVKERTGNDFPDDPREQLWGAVGAVFGSWNNDRAIAYRRLYDIPDELGHRRQRAGDGLRQHRRRLGHRRRLHARPGDRRERLLRRVPGQRPGRGRGRRRAHAAPGRRARRRLPDGLRGAARGAHRRSSASSATCRTSSSRSRRAASTCCRRATASAPAWPRSASPSTWCEEGLITPDEALMRIEPEQLNQLLRPVFVARGQARPPSTRAGSWPRVCPPAPAPPPARSSSTPPTPRRGRRRARRSCSCASRPAPRTSAAWTPRRASSPRAAA